MYKEPFFITKPVWNNAFSFDKRKNKKLYVPKLIEITNLEDIKLQKDKDKIAFEDFWFDDKLSTNYGLENFYEINPPPSPLPIKEGGLKCPIYLFDNHNHAYFFWYLARKKGIIWDNNTLLHIDEHADTRDNDKHLLKPESNDLEKVFEFTNQVLNVGDYIIPAQEEWIIWEVVQIRNTDNLEEYLENKDKYKKDIILNLDLDFFQPDLDFIDYNLKKKAILDISQKASIITVCTSPFFIDQSLAIKVFKDLFWN